MGNVELTKLDIGPPYAKNQNKIKPHHGEAGHYPEVATP